jgi:hypothetical protein
MMPNGAARRAGKVLFDISTAESMLMANAQDVFDMKIFREVVGRARGFWRKGKHCAKKGEARDRKQ